MQNTNCSENIPAADECCIMSAVFNKYNSKLGIIAHCSTDFMAKIRRLGPALWSSLLKLEFSNITISWSWSGG